jgi:hypothetical protein
MKNEVLHFCNDAVVILRVAAAQAGLEHAR